MAPIYCKIIFDRHVTVRAGIALLIMESQTDRAAGKLSPLQAQERVRSILLHSVPSRRCNGKEGQSDIQYHDSSHD